MISKQEKVVYFIVLLGVFLSAYNFYTDTKNNTKPRTLLEFDAAKLQTYMQSFDTNRSLNYIWGFKNEVKKVVKKQTDENNESNASKILLVVQKQQQICVEKNCFRLLGIYYKKQTPYVTLYNKDFTNNMDSFTSMQKLVKTLHVGTITTDSVTFIDTNTSREWNFRLFDVNATKYKPKDTNETNTTLF